MSEATPESTGERSLNIAASSLSEENHVSRIREGVQGMRSSVEESSLEEKMIGLRDSIEAISGEAQEWIPKRHERHLSNLEGLQQQVVRIQDEWRAWSDRIRSQLDRVDSLLLTFPGILEVSTLRALSLRVDELEQLVSNHIAEHRARVGIERSRKQLIVSLAALGVTIVLWLVFIVLQVINR